MAVWARWGDGDLASGGAPFPGQGGIAEMPYRTPKNPVLRAGLLILLGLAVVVMVLAVIWYIILLRSPNVGFTF